MAPHIWFSKAEVEAYAGRGPVSFKAVRASNLDVAALTLSDF